MRSTFYLTASALAALVSAQTFTDCNPMEKTCPNDPAIAETFETNFKAGKDAVKGWKQTAGTLNYGASGAEFTVAKKGDAPTIQTEGYLHFGYIEVKMKAAPGQGIISSIVLQSDDLDEVDWEFIGGVSTKVQMNYFGKGNTTTYDRMIEAPVSNVQEMHTYALNWTADALTWIIDTVPVRTLKFADANGGNNYPQTPSNVRIGIWAGGDSDNQGTREWAGGAVDYSKAPFTQTVESVKIINYSPCKEYQWTDKTGSYKSIKMIEAGNKEGSDQNTVVIQPSATSSGAGLGTQVNHPTGTGASGAASGSASGTGSPAQTGASGSSTCTEGKGHPSSTPSPLTNGTSPFTNTTSSCECGVLTITMTGTPPPSTTPTTVSPPPSSAPATSSPPYPTTHGIVTDTRPPPSAGFPTSPTGAVPTGNATTSAPVQFPGAATHNTAGTLFGLVAAVMMLAL